MAVISCFKLLKTPSQSSGITRLVCRSRRTFRKAVRLRSDKVVAICSACTKSALPSFCPSSTSLRSLSRCALSLASSGLSGEDLSSGFAPNCSKRVRAISILGCSSFIKSRKVSVIGLTRSRKRSISPSDTSARLSAFSMRSKSARMGSKTARNAG